MSSAQFSSTSIYNGKSNTGVILKEVNGQKLLIRLTAENWNTRNNRYADIRFTKLNETKMIAGYLCYKATASTSDGFEISAYYTRDLLPENKVYDAPFKNLEGLPLEYEFTKGNLHIRYTLASLSLNAVQASKFDIPTSGYRELTYEESRKLNLNN
jgi:GLPGLI family protein